MTNGPTDQSDTPDPTDASARPSPRLLEFLVCPATKTTLELSADKTELISRAARLAYPIRDGIPLLTTDSARDLTDERDK
jgi:uncharacterized protein